MANISVTAANVRKGTGQQSIPVVWGETVAAGQLVYPSGGKYYLSDATTAVKAGCGGVALTSGAADQPGLIQVSGVYTVGGTVVVGTMYCVSRTPGAIAPISDLANPDYLTAIGWGTSATQITLRINKSAVQKPS